MMHARCCLKALLSASLMLLGAAVFAQSITSLNISPNPVTAGGSTTGTVALSAAPMNNLSVKLSCSTSQASVPSQVTVNAGSTTATFTVATTNPGGNYSLSIYATIPHSSAKGILNVAKT
jgi:hypothetical protein